MKAAALVVLFALSASAAPREPLRVLEPTIEDPTQSPSPLALVAAAIHERVLKQFEADGRFALLGPTQVAPLILASALSRTRAGLRLALTLTRDSAPVAEASADFVRDEDFQRVTTLTVNQLLAQLPLPGRSVAPWLVTAGGAVIIAGGIGLLAVQAVQTGPLQTRITLARIDAADAARQRSQIETLRGAGTGLVVGGIALAGLGLAWHYFFQVSDPPPVAFVPQPQGGTLVLIGAW